MVSLLGPIVGISILIAIVVAYLVGLRTKHHYTSMLTCPKCQRTFEYRWVPLASFSAIRLGSSRYIECPFCREWSMFNIWKTRVGTTIARPSGSLSP